MVFWHFSLNSSFAPIVLSKVLSGYTSSAIPSTHPLLSSSICPVCLVTAVSPPHLVYAYITANTYNDIYLHKLAYFFILSCLTQLLVFINWHALLVFGFRHTQPYSRNIPSSSRHLSNSHSRQHTRARFLSLFPSFTWSLVYVGIFFLSFFTSGIFWILVSTITHILRLDGHVTPAWVLYVWYIYRQ